MPVDRICLVPIYTPIAVTIKANSLITSNVNKGMVAAPSLLVLLPVITTSNKIMPNPNAIYGKLDVFIHYLRLLYKLRFQFHRANAINLTVNIMITFDDANIFNFGSHLDHR